MTSEKTPTTDTFLPSGLNIVATSTNNINNHDDDTKNNNDLEAQRIVNDQNGRTLDDGEPIVQLRKAKLYLVMLGCVDKLI